MKKIYTLLALMATFAFAQAQPGMLDATFGTGGIVTTSVLTGYNNALTTVVQPDGKIIAAGNVGVTSNYDVGVVRYNEDGSLDPTFGLGGMVIIEASNFKSFAEDIALQADGKILLAGRIFNDISFVSSSLLIRLLPNGTLDNDFGTGGIVSALHNGEDNNAEAIALQQDGKILIAGHHEDRFAVMRFNSDGSVDNTFGTAGMAKADVGRSLCFINDITLQRDGKIIAAGMGFNDNSNYGFAVARFNTDGSLDIDFADLGTKIFNVGPGNDFLTSVKLQRNDKLVLGGHTWIANQPLLQYDLAVTRLNVDGSIDETFGNNGSAITNVLFGASYITGMILQPDDQIIIGSNINSQFDFDVAIARYTADGVLDNTFGTNGITTVDVAGFEDYCQGIALQPDGKIVSCGYSYNIDNSSVFSVMRFNNDIDYTSTSHKESVEFNVFPNPTQNQLTVELTNSSSDYQLDIIDLSGRSVYSTTLKESGNINVSELARGTYFVRLNSTTETGISRFIKD